MGQGVEELRVSARSIVQGVLSRWGVQVRFGHRSEAPRRPGMVGRVGAPARDDVGAVAAPPAASAGAGQPSRAPLTRSNGGGSGPELQRVAPRAVLFDDQPVDTRVRRPSDELEGIFSHARLVPPATAPAPVVEPEQPSRGLEEPRDRVVRRPPEAAEGGDADVPAPRPRRLTIVDTQIRRRKMRGTLGLVLNWHNDAMHAGVKAADAALTVARLSIDIHLRTRAARVDYAKTFSFALGREVGAMRRAPDRVPVSEPEGTGTHAVDPRRREARVEYYEPLTVPAPSAVPTAKAAPAAPAGGVYEARQNGSVHRAQGVAAEEVEDLYSHARERATAPFVPPASQPNGHGAHRSANGGYGPGN